MSKFRDKLKELSPGNRAFVNHGSVLLAKDLMEVLVDMLPKLPAMPDVLTVAFVMNAGATLAKCAEAAVEIGGDDYIANMQVLLEELVKVAAQEQNNAEAQEAQRVN